MTLRESSPSKSAFIRQFPEAEPDEIVAKGKEAGVEVTTALVSKIRSADKIKVGRVGKPKGKGPKVKGPKAKKAEPGAIKRFILAQPLDMHPDKLCEKAKKAGLRPPHKVYIAAIRRELREEQEAAKVKRRRKKQPGTALARRENTGLSVLPAGLKLLNADGVAVSAMAAMDTGDEITDFLMRGALKLGLLDMRNRIDHVMKSL